MTVREIYEKLSEKYPRELSAAWDNDGIMVSGDMDGEVKKVLVALDATLKTIEYARDNGFDLVVTHHPMIFKGIKAVTSDYTVSSKVIEAIRNNISIMSFHTRCDAADGGVNDALCEALGLEIVESFGDSEAPTLGRIALTEEMPAGELAGLVRDKLGCTSVRINGDESRTVKRIAVCGGDGKSFVYPALYAACDAFITGDAGYNMAGDASEEGLVTIEVGHFHSENPVCKKIAEEIKLISGIDAEIFNSCTYTVI